MPRESGHDRLYVVDRHTSVTPVEPLQPVRAGRPRVAFEPAPWAQARAVQRLLAGQLRAARRGGGARVCDDWNCGCACTDSSMCVFSRDVTPVPKPGTGSLLRWSGRASWTPCSAPGTRQGAVSWQVRRSVRCHQEAGRNGWQWMANVNRVSAVKVSVFVFLHERRAPTETWDAQ